MIKYIGEVDKLKELYQLNGADWQEFNIFGIRDSRNENTWNDTIGIAYGNEIHLFEATTDPGRTARLKHKVGANHLMLGFYKNLWKVGYSSKYKMKVFRQVGKASTWDDTNRNNELDDDDRLSLDKGPEWGIWMHTTTKSDLSWVNDSSWGCQVIKHHKEFSSIIKLAESSNQELFSYLLMPLKDENKYFHIG